MCKNITKVLHRFMHSKGNDYMLNYLTLKISDKEMRTAFSTAISHLSHKVYKPLAVLNTFTLIVYLYGLSKGGDSFPVVVNFITLFVIFMNPVLYRFQMHLCKWLLTVYFLTHCVGTVLLYEDRLGPLNTEDKGKYQN